MISKEIHSEKYPIEFFYDDLDKVLEMPASVFIADKKEDQDSYNIILSFTHFFNNLRDVSIISKLAVSESSKVEATNNPISGQFGGMKVFSDNLFFAFLLEFIQLLKNENNKKIIKEETFNKIIKNLNKRPREDWSQLLEIIYNPDDKLCITLYKIRNNLSFHFFEPKKIYEGYKMAIQNPENKMYLSLGTKMSSTRYYFYDLSNQLAIHKIIMDNGFSIEKWNEEIDTLIHLILSVTMNVIQKFITSRSAPTVAKIEPIQKTESFLKKP